MKAVADTNVIISSIFWRGTPYKVIRYGLEGRYTLVTSKAILKEVIKILRKKFNFPKKETKKFINILLKYCLIIKPYVRINIVKEDKTDNKIIEAAFSSKAQYIVTGDKHLLNLKKFKRIEILEPRNFLKKLINI